MNQKILNIIYGTAIVILIGTVIYLTLGKKNEPTDNQSIVLSDIKNITNQTNAVPTPAPANSAPKPAASSVPAPTDPTKNWKSYNNTRYGYTIKYPTHWFANTYFSEKDFTQRGLDNDLIGGDTNWSNYKDSEQGTLATTPIDREVVFLLIFKVAAQTSLDNFIILKNFSYSKKENININGINGIRLTLKDLDNPNKTSSLVLLKSGEKIFNFSHAKNSPKSTAAMDQMLQTFRLK